MAQDDSPVQLQACAMRITRCAADGTTPAGANNMYVTNQFAKIDLKPNYEAGQEFKPRNACGSFAANYKDRDILMRYDVDIELTTPDPELNEIATGGAIVTASGKTIGQLAVPTGTLPPGFGSCIEFWVKAIIGGQQAPVNPWFRYVMALAYLQEGDSAFQNDVSNRILHGYVVENLSLGNGPNNDFPASCTPFLRSVGRFRDATIPTPAVGYQATPAQV